jgi:hypothetical protein
MRALQGHPSWAITRIRHKLAASSPPWACLRIRHKRLRPVPPCHLQQLGRPVWRIRHTTPDGPPWLADLGLRRWYTYLLYPQHFISSHHSPFPTLENFLHVKLHTILLARLA